MTRTRNLTLSVNIVLSGRMKLGSEVKVVLVLIALSTSNQLIIGIDVKISSGRKARDNMKIIVLHDRYSNDPIIIRVDAITAIKKEIYREEDSEDECSTVFTMPMSFLVKEHIDVVMLRIKNADKTESEGGE